MWMEKNVFLAFLVQALVIAGIFAFAVCWFSFVRRFCSNHPWFSSDDDEYGSEAGNEASNKKQNYPEDLPPTYSQADLYSQMEVKATDILYPPPSYKELNLPTIPEEIHPSFIPIAAFGSPNRNARRNSAPTTFFPSLSTSSSSSPSESCSQPGGRTTLTAQQHRNSIAAISGNLVSDEIVQITVPEDEESSALTSKWLRPILDKVRRLSLSSAQSTKQAPRRQVDHPYVETSNSIEEPDPESSSSSSSSAASAASSRMNSFVNRAFTMDDPAVARGPRFSIGDSPRVGEIEHESETGEPSSSGWQVRRSQSDLDIRTPSTTTTTTATIHWEAETVAK